MSKKEGTFQRPDASLAETNQRLQAEISAWRQESLRLKNSIKSLETSRKRLEKENRVLELQLLEKEARIKELERNEASLRERLAETIQEVVRAKAKLRSLESRAEAASNIAETEIALKALKKQPRSQEQDPLVSQAEQLLKMSYKEFERENYGGALYLANQAKTHLKNIHLRPKEEPSQPLPGEAPFSIPIPLRVLTTSNLRAGPSLNYEVVSTLKPGTRLLAYSRKGEWLYVKAESGLKGWIFQTLVKGR
ncbi:MAG: SH3 domain-containing protein [Deltaproteobacteria bacterium]|nr:SH3 domain-containing protein [Deltaproteobacteria bacterium]